MLNTPWTSRNHFLMRYSEKGNNRPVMVDRRENRRPTFAPVAGKASQNTPLSGAGEAKGLGDGGLGGQDAAEDG